MEVKSLEQAKKEKIMIITGLIIIVVVFLVLYFVFIKKSEVSINNTPQLGTWQVSPAAAAFEEKLKAVDLNTDFLINKVLSVLKSNGDMPVKKGVTGRPNPFAR